MMKNKLKYFIILFCIILHIPSQGKVNNDLSKEFFIVQSDTVAIKDISSQENLDFLLIENNVQASYYHEKFTGRKTASGDVFKNSLYTAAHKTLPFGTKIRVTNLHNDKTVIVTINDRGPYTKGRSLDLSKAAFLELTNHIGKGVVWVKIERVIENES